MALARDAIVYDIRPATTRKNVNIIVYGVNFEHYKLYIVHPRCSSLHNLES